MAIKKVTTTKDKRMLLFSNIKISLTLFNQIVYKIRHFKDYEKMFYFLGKAPPSKSLFLRGLITQSYFSDFQILSQSQAQDVLNLQKALQHIQNPSLAGAIDCQNGAAVFRFLALRASRVKGCFVLTGSPLLFERPISELLSILRQLGAKVKVQNNQLIIDSSGWKPAGDALTVSTHRSSQFASAVILNCWGLNKDIFISLEGGTTPSYAYFQMTLSFLRLMGMDIQGGDKEFYIPAGQKLKKKHYTVEQDMSCLFAVSALCATGGQVLLQDFPDESLQPDFLFPQILKDMGFLIEKKQSTLKIQAGKLLQAINVNLKNTPDLFPVLSVLCALAKGQSRLSGAYHLHYKESDRIKETAKLLKSINCPVKVLKDGLGITGPVDLKHLAKPSQTIVCDPKEDHRIAMAAGVLQKIGVAVKILKPEVVNKSFPNFWQICR